MRKFSGMFLLSWTMLSSCSTVGPPSSVPIPVSTVTPWLTFTPSPIPTLTPTPMPSLSGEHYFYNLSKMVFTEATDGWAAGDVNSEGGCQFLIYHWDGAGWKEKTQLDQANTIFAQAPEDIFAVGTKIWYWNGDIWTDIS